MTLRKLIILTLSLLAAPLWGQITNSGSILIEWPETHRGVFEISGDFGGGTVYFERNIGGIYVEFEEGGYEDSSFYEFVTTSSELRVRVEDTLNPSLWISVDGRIIEDADWDSYIYYQPGGTDRYLQPDGTSLYERP